MADPLHRWATLGLAADLLDGKHSILVLASRDQIREAMDQVVEMAEALGASTRVRRTNGDEQIVATQSSGRLNFRTARQMEMGAARGFTLDVIATDEPLSVKALATVMPCVIASGGELIDLPHSR